MRNISEVLFHPQHSFVMKVEPPALLMYLVSSFSFQEEEKEIFVSLPKKILNLGKTVCMNGPETKYSALSITVDRRRLGLDVRALNFRSKRR